MPIHHLKVVFFKPAPIVWPKSNATLTEIQEAHLNSHWRRLSSVKCEQTVVQVPLNANKPLSNDKAVKAGEDAVIRFSRHYSAQVANLNRVFHRLPSPFRESCKSHKSLTHFALT